MRLPARVPTTTQLRSLEAQYIKECGSNWGQVLMEIAGREAAGVAFEIWQHRSGTVLVYCGRGNNGGDGLVVARYLHLWGVPVEIAIIAGDSKTKEFEMSSPEANANCKIAQKLNIPIKIASKSTLPDQPALVVDALLGTGIDRDVEGEYRKAIEWINRSSAVVLAVDLPSGINSDSGKVMAAAVRADHTATFGYLKSGLLIEPGTSLAGQITLVDIGLPNLAEQKAITQLTLSAYAKEKLPRRPTDSHKGTFGTVLTIAGSLGMTGATMLASESALRAGAGLSLLAVPRSLINQLPSREVIYRPLSETKYQSISYTALNELADDLEKCTAIILGPGMSTHEDTVKFVHEFVSDLLPASKKPCIIDADALNALSKNTAVFGKGAKPWVLTPHPKELSRLLNKPTADVQANRLEAASTAANKFGCVVVLKGARSIIASPDGQIFINPTGNSGMSTAGAGDVLSGIVGGLLAQGLQPIDAAALGVYIHGLAGDIAAVDIGDVGIVAGDISSSIPFALTSITDGGKSELESHLTELVI